MVSSVTFTENKLIKIFILNVLYLKCTKNPKTESKNIKESCSVDKDELTKQMWFVRLGLHGRTLPVITRSLWRILPSLVTFIPEINLLGGTLLAQLGLPIQTLLAQTVLLALMLLVLAVLRFPVDLVTFTEEILNGKLHILCSDLNGHYYY